MESFRLKVFRSVAKHLSFTKAASELFISQPAITKNIQALESEYGLRLFNRIGNRIHLTPAGKVLLDYAEKIFNLQLKLENNLNSFKEDQTGLLRLGASTTIAQYVITPALSKFHKNFPHIKLSLITGNSNQVADALIKGEIDLGIVEGKVKNRDLKYSRFISDELVAASSANNILIKENEISIEELTRLPLILRERGSGTLEVFEHVLKNKKVKLSSLNVLMYLGSTEAIKLFLESDECIGFISIRAIEKELKSGVLKIIKVKDLQIKRTFEFILPHGVQSLNAASKFIKLAKQHYNQK
ncbi:MAG: LysR substrate-binding domain-containing protein [Ignavibacteriaceae bacterium]